MPKLNKSVLERLIADITEDQNEIVENRKHVNAVKKAFDQQSKLLHTLKMTIWGLIDNINIE